jgi:hypothetical protein
VVRPDLMTHMLVIPPLLFRYLAKDIMTHAPWQWTLVEVSRIVSGSLGLCAVVAFVITLKRFAMKTRGASDSDPFVAETKSGEKGAIF